MEKNGLDFVSCSDEEEEKVIVYGSVKESQPIQTDKLSHARLNSISLLQDDDLDDRDSSALIKPDSRIERAAEKGGQASVAFIKPPIVTSDEYENHVLCPHRCCREQCKLTVASAGLVLTGAALLGAGVVIWASTYDFLQAIVFIVIGIILLIPGGEIVTVAGIISEFIILNALLLYHLIYVYCNMSDKHGYTQYSIQMK